jgi:hypothetical protein
MNKTLEWTKVKSHILQLQCVNEQDTVYFILGLLESRH